MEAPLSRALVCLHREALLFALQSESSCFSGVVLGPGSLADSRATKGEKQWAATASENHLGSAL